MTLSPILPDWVPWWAQLVLVVLFVLFACAFLMMPFAVFGLRGRLDLLEAQLDDIHAELRMLSMRLPDAQVAHQGARKAAEPAARPEPQFEDEAPAATRRGVRIDPRDVSEVRRVPPERPAPEERSEPRLRWPPRDDFR
ncbi:hypothetical protein [Lichenicoccus sp.]|uniref:hypothetical protein n=1 Tax=Lichenicoccus sp. TaxID=2781899 RepID=UPI003D0EFCAF